VADPRLTVAGVPDPAQPIFFYDLGSPACYLAAEEVMGALPVVPEWEPVLGAAIAADAGSSASLDRELVERHAAAQGLQPLRWPSAWPPETELAMRAATYAKHVGRAVAFSLAAFRQAFAGGRDLGDPDTVLIAAAACEMHPTAVLKGIELRSVRSALQAANERARSAGVDSLPAICAAGSVFQSEDAVHQAAMALGGAEP
jgi:2-hydroxychromene-2-carboxylate isomerase